MPTGLHHRKMEFTVGGKKGESAGGLQSTVGNNTTERERTIYVDYVRDITDSSGGYGWSAPYKRDTHIGPYRQPESVELCCALCEAGAKSSDGLAVIAEFWREFVPEKNTSRKELRDVIVSMLSGLVEGGHGIANQPAKSLIVSSWSFPLWPFDLNRKPSGKTVDELREERRRTIKWIERTEARRDPPPSDRTGQGYGNESCLCGVEGRV